LADVSTQLLGTTGTVAANYVGFYNDANQLTGNSNFQVNNGSNAVTYTISAGVTGSNYNLSPAIGDPSHIFDIVNNGSAQFTIRYCTFGTGAGVGQNDVHYVRARGTANSPLNTQSADYLMSTGFRGAYGTGSNGTFGAMTQSAAAFQVYTTEDWVDSTHNGCAFAWETTTNATSATSRHRSMTLFGDGRLLLGTTNSIANAAASSYDLINIENSQNAGVKMNVYNSNSGNAALCGYYLRNNNAKGANFFLTSSGYTANGILKADAVALYTDGVGGLGLGALNGTLSLWQGGNTLGTNDVLNITSGITSIRNSLYVGGQVTPTYKLDVAGDIGIATTNKTLRLTTSRLNTITLVAGTATVSLTGVTASSLPFISLVSESGTLGAQVKAVCSSGSITFTSVNTAGATNTLDTSTYSYVIFENY
jgi:hypothetical protein